LSLIVYDLGCNLASKNTDRTKYIQRNLGVILVNYETLSNKNSKNAVVLYTLKNISCNSF